MVFVIANRYICFYAGTHASNFKRSWSSFFERKWDLLNQKKKSKIQEAKWRLVYLKYGGNVSELQ